jgi:hypothetical protein
MQERFASIHKINASVMIEKKKYDTQYLNQMILHSDLSYRSLNHTTVEFKCNKKNHCLIIQASYFDEIKLCVL